MSTFRIFGVGLALAVASACASNSASSGPRAPSRNRDLISERDIATDAALRSQAVLDVIRQLRPHFLNDRGLNTIVDSAAAAQGAVVDPEAGKVHVSVDNGRVVPLVEIASMHMNEVIEIRYFNAGQAMAKFGSAARQGPIIAIKTTVVR